MDLNYIGITNQEYKVYLELLKKPSISIVDLSSSTGVKRTTLYSVLGRMHTKGLLKKKNGVYSAQDPTKLLDLAKEHENKAKKEMDNLKSQLPLLNAFWRNDIKDNQIETFVYFNDLSFAKMEEIVGQSKSQMYGLSNYHWINECFVLDAKNKVKPSSYLDTVLRVGDRFVFTGNTKSYKEAKKFIELNPIIKNKWEPRWIDENELKISININTYEDKVLITPITKNKQTLYIKNKHIAKSFQDLCNYLWKNAKKV